MAANPLKQAHKQALRDIIALRLLFWRMLGSSEHPRGRLLTAYRSARREMASVLRSSSFRAQEANDVLIRLQTEVQRIGAEAVQQASELGRASAEKQIAAYSKAGLSIDVAAEVAELEAVLDGVTGSVESQLRQVHAMVRSGASVETIVGAGQRLGALQPGPVARELARWITTASAAGTAVWIAGRDGRLAEESPFQRQAIAAIDHLTTDCCLRVHGQIVGMEEDFHLTGVPRYADHMRRPPFHDYCRTVWVLYNSRFDDELTGQMTAASRAELAAREHAQSHIDELKAKLAELGEYQDVRIRKDDSDEVKKLRNDLRMWRARLREDIWPSHARSGRSYREEFVG